MSDVNKILQEKVFNKSFYQFQKVFQPSLQDSPINDYATFGEKKNKDEFYIRANASSLPMNMQEAVEYIKSHF
jgi:hypothetical protein